MRIESVADLVQALRETDLLEPEQFDELAQHLQDRFADPRALAKDLLQRGWLTAYQINQLFLGRGPELLLGNYVLLERLGEGSMGSVFKARHRKSGRTVALKLVRRDRLENPNAVERFRREIRALAQLVHPNVVLAHDADWVGDVNFFTMEYVEGQDLSKRVKQRGPLPVWEACEYVRQAALGLQHAHEQGVVHRDIKPSNLLVTADGSTVKILDMGLARFVGPLADEGHFPALTQLKKVLGTPDYISPEQARDSRRVDIRADLYSLGCTFYHLLAGHAPFSGGSSVDKLLRHCAEEPPPVNAARGKRLAELRRAHPDWPLADVEETVPPEVEEVLEKLMAKRPEDRFQTPAEVVEVLGRLIPPGVLHLGPPEGVPGAGGGAPPEGPTVEEHAGLRPAAADDTAPPLSRWPDMVKAVLGSGQAADNAAPLLSRWPLLAAAGVALLLLLAVLVLAYLAGHPPAPPSSRSPRHGGLASPAGAVTMTALPPGGPAGPS